MLCWRRRGPRERRLRLLPSRVGVYFVLALCLFPQAGYLGVWAKLTAALDGLGVAVPVREGAAGPAPPDRRRAAESAVRDAGRAAGPAAHAGDDVRPVPDGRLRRLPVAQGPRHGRGTGPGWAR